MRPKWKPLLAGAVLVSAALAVHATSVEDRVTGSDVRPAENFGFTLAFDGEWLAVPASLHSLDGDSDEDGAVYVFQRQPDGTFDQQQKLFDGISNDEFGEWVALDGDRMVVVKGFDPATLVYLRTSGVWAVEDTFNSGTTFPDSVAIAGDTVFVGHGFGDSAAADGSGIVELYTRSGSNWSADGQIEPSLGEDEGDFGCDIDIDGDTLVVGAPGESTTGAVYVYTDEPGGWTEQQRILPPASVGAAEFGVRIGLSGDTLIVGAPLENIGTGAAYVYVRSQNTWTLQERLAAPGGSTDEFFGGAVDVDGDLFVVTAPGRDDPTGESGVGYLYRRFGTTYSDPEMLLPANRSERLAFGASASISGTLVAVGAAQFNVITTQPGEVFVFDEAGTVPPPPPVDRTVDGFLLPTTVSLRLPASGKRRRRPDGLSAKGAFDTGRKDIDFSASGTISVGTFEAAHSGFSTVGRSRTLRATVPGATMTIVPSRSGNSKAKFVLEVQADLSGDVAADGETTLGVTFGEDEISAGVRLAGGAFKLRRDASALSEPILAPKAVRATLLGPGRDSVRIQGQFATPGTAPGFAPDVKIAFGGLTTTIPGGSFKALRRNRFRFRGNQDTVRSVTLDYAKGKVVVIAKRTSLGSVGTGVVDILARLCLDDDERAVRFRATRKRRRLSY